MYVLNGDYTMQFTHVCTKFYSILYLAETKYVCRRFRSNDRGIGNKREVCGGWNDCGCDGERERMRKGQENKGGKEYGKRDGQCFEKYSKEISESILCDMFRLNSNLRFLVSRRSLMLVRWSYVAFFFLSLFGTDGKRETRNSKWKGNWVEREKIGLCMYSVFVLL